MKQQVRLRVLIPLVLVAVAGLLVWKFVLADDGVEQAAEPAAVAPQPAAPEGAPADAATPIAPGTPAAEAAPPADGDLVAALTTICQETQAKLDALDYGTTPASAETALRRAVGIDADAVARVGALSTVGEQSATLAELQATVRQAHDAATQALDALVGDRYVRAFGLIDKSDRLSTRSDELAATLGVPDCSGDQAAASDEDLDAATYAVADKLDDSKVVVAVVYAPDADVDAVTLREARAGALAAKAGFVAIDGTRDSAIRVIASKLELRETPAILVFARSGGLSTRLDGFADRQTVAQAVQNAKAPA